MHIELPGNFFIISSHVTYLLLTEFEVHTISLPLRSKAQAQGTWAVNHGENRGSVTYGTD